MSVRSLLLAWLASLSATESALRLLGTPDHAAMLRTPGLVLLVLGIGTVAWGAYRAARPRVQPGWAGALAVLVAAGLAAGAGHQLAGHQLPAEVAGRAQWWSHGHVHLAPVDRWRAEPQLWRALVVGDCGTLTVVEAELRDLHVVVTEWHGDASTAFLLGYALGGWRSLPARRRAAPTLSSAGPDEALGWTFVRDDQGARLDWRRPVSSGPR